MNCPKCNTPLEADDVFCPECGAKLDAAPVPPPVPAPMEPPAPAAKPKKKPALKKVLAIVLAAVVVLGGVAAAVAVYFGWVGFPIRSMDSNEEYFNVHFTNYSGFSEIRGNVRLRFYSIAKRAYISNPNATGPFDTFLYSDHFKAGEVYPGNENSDTVNYEFKLSRKPEQGGQYDGCYRLELWRAGSMYGTTPQNMSYYAVVYIKEIDSRTYIMYRDGLPEMYFTHYPD